MPGPVRQADVHDHDVRLEPAGLLDRLGDGAGLGDDLEALAPVEQRDEALADDLVVVDDQQAQRMRRRSVGRRARLGRLGDGLGSACGGRGSGTVTMIRVPSPGVALDRSVPPSAAARSRMLASPWWLAGPGSSTGSKPRPSSSIGEPQPSLVLRERDPWPGRAGVAGDVATAPRGRCAAARRAACPEQVGRRGRDVDARPRRSTVVQPDLLGEPRPSAADQIRLRRAARGRSPTMNVRMSAIAVCSASIARSTRALGLGRVLASISSGDVLERQADARRWRWMIPSWRSLPIRSRSSTTARRWTWSWSRAFSMAIPAWSANISTSSLVLVGELGGADACR